jgi:hypothetical protein
MWRRLQIIYKTLFVRLIIQSDSSWLVIVTLRGLTTLDLRRINGLTVL